jgi:anaerobic selenocysteine-containing dehydrogenase
MKADMTRVAPAREFRRCPEKKAARRRAEIAIREVKSFCRFCMPFCGTRVTLDDQDRVVTVRGDRDDLMTKGYACIKGIEAAAAHYAPDRILRPLKRGPDGSFTSIAIETALDEIADTIRHTVDRHGGESIGGFCGSGSLLNASATSMLPAFLTALGSHKHFTTFTIDQSAKAVTMGRMGFWNAPRHPLHDSDVRLLFGANPLVSLTTSYFDMTNPMKRMKEARARGLKVIVVDPHRTETANFADVFLQPFPGEDPTIAAGLIHIILREACEDADFCAHHVADLEALRTAVAPFTPDYVSERAGVVAADLWAAAHLFAAECKRGGAAAGTGPSMAPHSNLSDHLIETLNVVCGRYQREGERVVNPGVLRARAPRSAQVVPAGRWWDHGFQSRIGGYGMIGDEMMGGIMADEILEPGANQVRCFISHGSNLANVIPDQRKMVRALKSLELFVNIDPFMNETSRLADYILPTKMGYERDDLTMFYYESLYAEPYARYTPAISTPPDGAELIDDWEIYWGLAKRLGLNLVYDGVPLDMAVTPTTDSLLAVVARHAPIPFEELKKHEMCGIFEGEPQYVGPSVKGYDGRFTIAPDDVAEELKQVLAERDTHGAYRSNGGVFTHRLTSRRIRDVQNSSHRNIPAIRKRMPNNFAYLHSDDLARMGLGDGDRIEISSDAGAIPAVVEADNSVKPGVVQMRHGWGSLPDETDYDRDGANTGLLISTDRDLQSINAMPRMSAVPVNIAPLGKAEANMLNIVSAANS